MIIKILNAVLTVAVGVGGALALYWLLNKIAELLPTKGEDGVKPYLYLLPALAAIGLYLVYPAYQTVVFSFANYNSTEWVGLQNFRDLLSSSNFHTTLFNTALWIVVVPTVTIILGLIIAVLVDRLN